MKKTDELKKEINAKKAEIDRLQSEEQIEAAAKAAKELNAMVDQYEIELAKERASVDNFLNGGCKPINQIETEDKTKIRNRAFNKLVLNLGKLTEEERNAYFNVSGTPGQPAQVESIPTKGGYLVPEEQLTTIREFRKAYTQLRQYCHVVTANSTSGVYPTLGEESGLLVKFDELTQIQESDFEFGQSKYEIVDFGDIIPVSNQLISDANVSIVSIIGQRLARKAVNTENAEILKLLNALTPTAITNYKGLSKALIKDLDPVYYANARIFTNQDGFLWLANLEDANNRPLLVPDVTAADSYRFRGKPVVVVPNSVLPNDNDKAPMYVGNMSDYIMFFERQGVEISVSTEYLWAKYGTALRCVVRFGVTEDDTDSLKAYTVPVSA